MRDRLPRLISSMMKTWRVSGLVRARSQKRWKTPSLRVKPPPSVGRKPWTKSS